MSTDERSIVSVRLEGLPADWDVETPVDLPAAELGRAIAETLGWTVQAYTVFADPPGRVLAAAETLAEAGAWDGAALTLRPESDMTATPHPPVSERRATGYVWKRIDDA